jgi:hypothetical protein
LGKHDYERIQVVFSSSTEKIKNKKNEEKVMKP